MNNLLTVAGRQPCFCMTAFDRFWKERYNGEIGSNERCELVTNQKLCC